MIEYTPLSPVEIELLRQKEARGELTPEDTRRFIESVRASFTARPAGKPTKAQAPKAEDVDFF